MAPPVKDTSSLAELTDELQDTIDSCESGSLDTQGCASRLETQLLKLRAHAADTAKQRSLQNLIRRAKLRLFSVHTEQKRDEEAQAALLDIIAVSSLSQDELFGLGPSQANKARAAMQRLDLQARGTIEVTCTQPCIVTVNDTLVDNPISLPLGRYRLAVTGLAPESSAMVQPVELVFRGQSKTFTYPELSHEKPARTDSRESSLTQPNRRFDDSPEILPTEDTEPHPLAPHPGPAIVPIFSRTTMQIGMASALLITVAGSALWSMDGHCLEYIKNVVDDRGNPVCKPNETLNSKVARISILGIGAAALIAGSTLLAVERAKGRRAAKHKLVEPANARELHIGYKPRQARPRGRHFPRWLELTGLGVGLAGLVSGSIALGYDSKRIPKKTYNYDNKTQGTALVVGGAQFLVFSAIFLAIDEWPRARRLEIRPQGLGFRF